MPAVPALDTAARRCAAVLAAAVLLPVAACTSDGEDAPHGSSGAARDLRTAPRDQIAGGGTLRWAVDAMPTTLNAFQPDATRATDRIAGAVLPQLFGLDSRARPQPNADYLQDAEVTTTEPRQTVVYTLNREAKWSDGRAIGVADFKAQWKALNGGDSAFWTARNAGYERIAKVTKGDGPHQVKVTFRKPYADWQALFTPLYPKSVMSKAKTFNDGARADLPAYAGPFKVKGEIDAEDDDTVTLVRNPDWWGDRAKLERITLPAVPHGKREKALAAGELDLAEIDPSVAERIDAARTSDAKARDAKARDEKAPDGKAGDGEGAQQPGEPKQGEAGPEGGPRAAVPQLPGMVTHEQAVDAMLDWAAAHSSEKALKAAREAEEKRAAAAAERRNLGRYAVRRALEPAYTQLALNGGSGPLSDERVRRALARTLDREALADHVLGAAGLPGEPLGSHLRMRDQHGYRDNSDALGDRDVASAEALLAEAGWDGQLGEEQQDEPVDAKKGKAGDDGKREKKDTGDGDGAATDERPPGDAPDGTARAAGAEADGGEGDGGTEDGTGTRADEAAVPVGADEAARVQGVPLSLAPDTASQRAGLLAQVARAEAAAAEDSEEDEAGKKAREAKRAAAAARERADEMRLLSDGRAATVRTKNGKPLALRFLVPAGPGTAAVQDTGERIARMLNEIGVRTDIERIKDESLFRDHIASGEYDLALYSWPATAFPATDARPIFAKPVPAEDGSLVVQQNWTRVGTHHIDQLFEQAAGELDEGKRNDLLRRADARIWAAAGSVPLYQRPQLVAARKDLANAGAFGFQTPRYQDIGYVK